MSNADAAFSDAETLAAALARTRGSYDETPYFSAPLIRLHPARMAANARWFGLGAPGAPGARTARVLEIGCASGGHLIPLAAALPDARLVGVDLSAVQIAAGKTRVERLGLTNIALDARSLGDIGAADGDAYLAHEIFEDANAPCSFSDFCAALGRHGLAYLGESVISANCEESLVPDGALSIRALARGAGPACATRAAHRSRARARDHGGVPHRRAAGIASDARRRPRRGEWLVADADEGVFVREAAAAEAIERLIARLPRSSRLEDIAPAGSSDPAARLAVAETLRRMVQYGQCAVSLLPVDCAARLSERPVAWSLAASDACAGDATASLRHAPVRLEPLQRLFLPLLDGTHTREDRLAYAIELAERDVLQFNGPEGRVEGRENFAARLGPAVDRCLESLLRLGLLVEA